MGRRRRIKETETLVVNNFGTRAGGADTACARRVFEEFGEVVSVTVDESRSFIRFSTVHEAVSAR